MFAKAVIVLPTKAVAMLIPHWVYCVMVKSLLPFVEAMPAALFANTSKLIFDELMFVAK